MWNFFYPIILIVLSIPLIIVVPSLIIAGVAFRKSEKEFARKILLWIRWWIYNNNGWFTIFVIVTIILHLVAIQKTISQPPVSKWDHEIAMSDPNSRTNKLYNFAREAIRGEKNYIPIVGNPPKGPRPTYHMWGLRALVMSIFTFLFLFYAAHDEVSDAIKSAWHNRQLRIQEEQAKPAKERVQGQGLTKSWIFLSDLLTEFIGLRFGPQRRVM